MRQSIAATTLVDYFFSHRLQQNVESDFPHSDKTIYSPLARRGRGYERALGALDADWPTADDGRTAVTGYGANIT